MQPRWKQAGLAALSLLAVFVAVMTATTLLRNYPRQLMINPSEFEGQLDLAIVSLLAYLAAVRWIEGRLPVELSLRGAPRVFAVGTLVGIGLFALVMAFLWIIGAYQPQGWGTYANLARGLVFMLAVAVREEIWYRALMFRVLSKVAGTWGALPLGAAWFVVMHAGAPGATVTGLITVGLAGVLFAAAYAATGRLWLPIGLHLGWNFAEGWLFGTSVSGHELAPSLINGKLDGPAILTGGNFGPEASVVSLAVVFAAAIYLLWRIVKLKCAEPPIWSDVRPVASAAAA